MVKRFALALALACWALIAARAQTTGDGQLFPPKPEPAVYVHDYAGWLSGGEKMQLEQKLRRYWDSTSTQIVVMIRPDLGDYDKATYAIELGNRWGVGQKGKNNGVIMVIKTQPPDRGIFIATGYGTEGGLTDLQAGMIIRNTMAPYFREQRWYEGIDAGLNDIIASLEGEFKAEPEDATSDEAALLIVGLVFLFFLLLFIFIARRVRKGMVYTNSGPVSRRSTWGGPVIWGGGWGSGGGGWSSGGGGWGGGGGFGGGSFGGGSFGGGGAGGDW
jgi:uncharacterized protein